MKEIKNYEVVINEDLVKCAIVINENENVQNLIENKDLLYLVNFKEKEIIVSEKDGSEIIKFKNANQEVLNYSYKSSAIPLAIGTLKTETPQIIFETIMYIKED